MSAAFAIEGLRELEVMLRQLGKLPAIRRAARAALREGGEPIIARAKALAPEDVGHLKQSIKAATAKRDRGDDGDQVAIVIGIDASVQPPRDVPRANGKGTYRDPGVHGVAPINEFGRPEEGIAARPFMRPAWDAEKDATASRVGDALGSAIEREAAKLAKRAGSG